MYLLAHILVNLYIHVHHSLIQIKAYWQLLHGGLGSQDVPLSEGVKLVCGVTVLHV